MEDKSAKRVAAEERQSAYERLSISDRIAKLDEKLGKGVGAVKERAKLANLLANPKAAPKRVSPPVQQEPQPAQPEENQ